jgi:NADH:ubiquinone oxidoreductase subunit 2 (subunit N)
MVIINVSMYIIALAIILFSVISSFYYIRLIKILYFENVLVSRLYYPLNNQSYFIVVFFIIFH